LDFINQPYSVQQDHIRQEAMDFAQIGWWSFRFNGTVVHMDQTTLRIMELEERFPDPELVVGQRIEDLVHYDSVGSLRSEIRKHGSVRGLEWTFITPLGNEKCVVQDSYLVVDPETREEHIQVVIHDITERKQMEDLLEGHARLLEQSNADLQRRNEELDDFAYLAGHDFKDPVLALADRLEKLGEAIAHQQAQRAQDTLTEAKQSVAKLSRLVHDMIALVQSGREVAEVSLDDVIDEVLDGLELHEAMVNAEIQRESLPRVWGDRGLLTQLYQHLLVNALKYRGENAPRIRLTAEETAQGWVMGVEDQGIGIEPHYVAVVFEPFKRLHRPGEPEGTGIGLALCRRIVEKHGGRIWAESEPGKGTRLKFTLGVAAAETQRTQHTGS